MAHAVSRAASRNSLSVRCKVGGAAARAGMLSQNFFFARKTAEAHAWSRTTTGAAQRVTILFDSGTSHCFVHPRVLADLEIMPHTAAGLNNLQMADEHVIACQGTADRLQILVGPHKQRVSLVAAETGTDDVIIGGEVLEIAQDGFRRAGFWSMCVDGKTLEIPYWAA